ncbi:putative sulfate exporter family transporter [Arthrobacter sp. ISL-30]|nr:putative sulfate exporter family transporter [Arthrobacter sp. ISL-30]
MPFSHASRLGAGVVAAVAGTGLAFIVHALVPSVPAMTAAVALGLLSANIPATAVWIAGRARAGLDFAGKHLMRPGIVLLGLKVSIMDVLGLGWFALLLISFVVLASFAGSYGAARALRLPREASLLIATGFSICGASAIGAMAAVRRIRHADTVLPVALVTLCGTVAIGVLPLLIHPLGLDPREFGAWTGASVHDVGQVVATAQTAGPAALAIAVVVKLSRVILLAPIAAAAGIQQRLASRQALRDFLAAGTDAPAHPGKLPPIVPLFVLGFVIMVAVRSLGWVDPVVLAAAGGLQDVLLAAALFGLGSAVRVRTLMDTGGRALLVALIAWLLIALLGLGAVWLMV